MTSAITIPTTDAGKPRKPLGVVWYADEAAYRAVAHLCGDMDAEAYAAWLEAAESAVGADVLGVPRTSVPIDAQALSDWCAAKQVVPNGAARSRFVLERVEAAFDEAWRAWKADKKPRLKLW